MYELKGHNVHFLPGCAARQDYEYVLNEFETVESVIKATVICHWVDNFSRL